VHELSTTEQVQRLHAGTLDAGLVGLPVTEGGLSTVLLHEDPLVVAVPTDHALAGRDALSLDDLARQPLIWWRREPEPGTFDRCARQLERDGFCPTVVQEASSKPAILALVAAGVGGRRARSGVARAPGAR
jgi:DNA-binding transcriptional LysR family regulator